MSRIEYPTSLEGLPKLETFPNPEQERQYWIEFTCPEWTAVCPISGFPDFGTFHIRYIPKKSCLELKSLKLYINSFRNIPTFHEAATNFILNQLVAACDPHVMEITGDFNVRGNIKTVVRTRYPTLNPLSQ